jgi:hypothetical protein
VSDSMKGDEYQLEKGKLKYPIPYQSLSIKRRKNVTFEFPKKKEFLLFHFIHLSIPINRSVMRKFLLLRHCDINVDGYVAFLKNHHVNVSGYEKLHFAKAKMSFQRQSNKLILSLNKFSCSTIHFPFTITQTTILLYLNKLAFKNYCHFIS